MSKEQEIHILTKELIPFYRELDTSAQEVILRHLKGCDSCKELQKETNQLYVDISAKNNVEKSTDNIMPFKKLIKFRVWLKTLLIAIRVLLLFFITTTFLQNDFEVAGDIVFLDGSLWMMYFPIVIFLLIFTLVFVSKKTFCMHLILDLLILFSFTRVLSIII